MRPVRADSKMPKGAMSFMKESIRAGFAELRNHISPRYSNGVRERVYSQLDDTVVRADIQNLPLKLMGKICNRL